MQKPQLLHIVSFLAYTVVIACSSDTSSDENASGGTGNLGGQAGSATAAGGVSNGGHSGATAVGSGIGAGGTSTGTGATAVGGASNGGYGGTTGVAGAAGLAGDKGVLAGAPGTAGSGAGTSVTRWVGTWATGLQTTEPRNLPTPADDKSPTPDNPGFAGNTLRQVVHVSMGGTKVRLRLSNEYGVTPVTMEAVHVAKWAGAGAIDVTTDKPLAFSGQASVTIPAGSAVNSDAFDFTLEPLSDLAITIKFGAQSKDVTGHPGSRTNSYLQTGNALTDATLASPIKTAHWYFISGLDVVADEKSGAVVVLGDSLTDGRGSTTDGNDRWTDVLAARLQADPNTKHVAVLNQGIGGNALVNGGIGPTGKARFDHDVIGAPGVKWLIVLEGVNDIGGSSTDISADLIAAYQEFITKAHAKQIKAFFVPILPFKGSSYDSLAHQTIRTTVNNWIRTSGKPDAVVDLDAVVRDPADPDKLLSTYAEPNAVGVDYLHLNPVGYKAMGDGVSLSIFQ